MPHHDSRRQMHTNPALHTPLQPTDQSEVAASLLASLHGTSATYLCCYLCCPGPQWPLCYRVGGVLLCISLYSCKFMSASQRPGQRVHERNTSFITSSALSVHLCGTYWKRYKGATVLCSIPRHLRSALTSKHVSLLCFQGKKFTSIRVKCAPL